MSFLVNEHLFLIKTATRRDINDEETAVFCARKIKDIERLKMLYLLTIADSMATGPRAWNDWTFTLLRDLFLKTLNILEKGELASNEAVKDIEKKNWRFYNPQTRRRPDRIGRSFSISCPPGTLFIQQRKKCWKISNYIKVLETKSLFGT